jgi:flagellin
MSRIMTNVSAMIAARVLNGNNTALSKSLQRLSTGYRINSGSDDPAGLIASENLRGDIAAVKSALTNGERASSVVSTAEGALSEISSKLIDLKGLVEAASSSGGLTQSEIDANQTQVDGIIASINRIASETSFQGMKLLDGSLGITASATGANVSDIDVRTFKQTGTTNATLTVTVKDSAAAATGGATAAVVTAQTWEIAGAKGTSIFTFENASTADISAAINAMSAVTGVKVAGGSLVSTEYGSNQFVHVKHISGATGGLAAGNGTDGTDASINVNGLAATVRGNNVTFRTENMDVAFRVTDTLLDATATTETITIKAGGGATFQLSPNVGLAGQETLGIPSVSSYHLGQQGTGFVSDIATGQLYNLNDDPSKALKVVNASISQVATLRGRLGSFVKDTVQTTMNSLNVQLENVSAAESAIRDTDFATETSNMTRNQILVSAAKSALALANSSPASVLSLLNG